MNLIPGPSFRRRQNARLLQVSTSRLKNFIVAAANFVAFFQQSNRQLMHYTPPDRNKMSLHGVLICAKVFKANGVKKSF
jgi:hypothetical protein